MGTFSYYATDLSRYEEGNTEMGGILKRLVFDGDKASTDLEGPPSPIVRGCAGAAACSPGSPVAGFVFSATGFPFLDLEAKGRHHVDGRDAPLLG